MPLITNAQEAKFIYQKAALNNFSLPAFNAENIRTVEAILQAASEFSNEYYLKNMPVIIAFTAHYHARQQLIYYTSLTDVEEGYLAIKSDILRLTRKGGPYDKLNVMVHLDHAHPVEDRKIIEDGVGFLSGVMYDCSHLPLSENIKLTAAFVEQFKEKLVIEGAVDEIPESGNSIIDDELTKAGDAERYVKETKVDLIVCNLGTEHRATLANRKYNGKRAIEISKKVGKILALHGTSSLRYNELKDLAADGVIKVNIWTKIEETGGQALARDTVKHVKELLSEKPPLEFLTESHRRYEVWMPAVVERIKNYLKLLGCERLK